MNGKFIMTLVVLLLCVGATAVGIMLSDQPTETPVQPDNQQSAALPEEKEEEQKEPEETEPVPEEDPTDTWELILANPDHPLPEDFQVETAPVQGNFVMDIRVADSMKEMIAAAQEDGVELMICSSYRSIQRQQELFDEQVAIFRNAGKSQEEAEAETATMIAVPGTSEHQTGLAADIVTPSHQTLDPEFAETAAGKWLTENTADYGFILRYPKDKEAITKIIYESWHYRYVGVEHAKAMKEKGLCLEEYLEELKGGE